MRASAAAGRGGQDVLLAGDTPVPLGTRGTSIGRGYSEYLNRPAAASEFSGSTRPCHVLSRCVGLYLGITPALLCSVATCQRCDVAFYNFATRLHFLQLCNMLTLEELSNPREYEEICGDIEEELEARG